MTEVAVKQLKPDLYECDLPDDRLRHYLSKSRVAVDTETRGLNINRDRLCLIQICDEDGVVSLVRYKENIDRHNPGGANVRKLLEDRKVLKIFHYARFDVAFLKYYLGAETFPLWCTKIASKLVRTYSDKHSLKDLVVEILKKEIDKTNQMSDWASDNLTEAQLEYAANDVRVLLPIQQGLEKLLQRENRLDLALRLFQCLPAVCDVDMGGWKDIFDH